MLLRCAVCEKTLGKPAGQFEAPLLSIRLDLRILFSTAGSDFCGPFYTKYPQETTKIYVALFSCCTVRALHLEAVPSMTAPQTGLAIRRFLAVRQRSIFQKGCIGFEKIVQFSPRSCDSRPSPRSDDRLAVQLSTSAMARRIL